MDAVKDPQVMGIADRLSKPTFFSVLKRSNVNQHKIKAENRRLEAQKIQKQINVSKIVKKISLLIFYIKNRRNLATQSKEPGFENTANTNTLISTDLRETNIARSSKPLT
jgi:hypothetical protein